MNTLSKIKYVLWSLLFLVMLINQVQMQSEIRELRRAQLKFSADVVKFMESTNSSIEAHNAAIASGNRIMKILVESR